MSSVSSQPKKRRCPYTSVACDNCKRRKTKCSGGKPCKGCGDAGVLCVYERTTRFRSNGRSPQAKCKRPRQSPEESHPSPISQATDVSINRASQSIPSPTSPTRPGASDYYLSLARQRLTAMSPEENVPQQQEDMVEQAGMMRIKFLVQQCMNTAGAPLYTLLLNDWVQIIQVYEDEIGLQYPFLDIHELRETIRSTKQATSQGAPEMLHSHIPKRRYQERVEDISTLIFAAVSILADPVSAERSKPLVEAIYTGAVSRSQLGNLNEDDLVLIILGSIFFFLRDQEILAWRGIGMVFRLLQELVDNGPDKSQPHVLPNDQGVISPEFYWSVYTLDRRWSFGTGLPFAVQDSDVRYRPSLKDNSLSSAYLKSMVAYCEIASEVQRSILEIPQAAISVSKRDFLNFRVVQWQQNLPETLRFSGIDDKFDPVKEKRGEYKLRLALYLRANQMRIIIHRKFMARSELNVMDATEANVMASITRDSIRVLLQLARDTDIYIAQQKTFNHFLETALSSLLLIMSSAEDLKKFSPFSDVVEALELVEQLASQSAIMQNLWCKVQSIKEAVKDIQARISSDRSCYDGPNSKPGIESGEAGVLDQGQPILSPTEIMYSTVDTTSHTATLMEDFDSLEALEDPGGLNFAQFPELGQFLHEYENFYF